MNYTSFTNLYSLQKTLRFELIPQGETERNIRENRNEEGSTLLERDTIRADKYKRAKEIINIYHRYHIDRALALADFQKLQCWPELEYLQEHLFQKDFADAEQRKQVADRIAECQEVLRKALRFVLTGNLPKKLLDKHSDQDREGFALLKERYALLSKEELFDRRTNAEFRSVALQAGVAEEEFESTINYFKGFTTYFGGFNENRENMYSEGKEGTAIAYRVIHENLPRFLDNLRLFALVKSRLPGTDLRAIEEDLRLEAKLESYFQLEHFQNCLHQPGIAHYNMILGGFFEEHSNRKKQGLNEKINLYNQTHPDSRLPRLKPLYKQILSESQGISFRAEPFETDAELLEALQHFWEQCVQNATDEKDHSKFNVLQTYQEAQQQFSTMTEAQQSGVFLNARRMTALSHEAFGQWSLLKDAMQERFLFENPDLSESKKEKELKALFSRNQVSLAEVEKALEYYFSRVDLEGIQKDRKSLLDFFSSGVFVEAKETAEQAEGAGPTEEESVGIPEVEVDIVKSIRAAFEDVRGLIEKPESVEAGLHQDKARVLLIKRFLDSLKALQHHLSYLHAEESSSMEKDDAFYGLWEKCYEALTPLNQLYNKVRNRLTRKPFSREKLKLNFDNSTLLNGWDISKERDNLAVLLERNGLYYLAIMERHHRKLFEEAPQPTTEEKYRKINYKLLPGPNKMLPKVFFSATGLAKYEPSKEILALYQRGAFKQGAEFEEKKLHKLIDFYKDAINRNPDWEVFDFQFRNTTDYKNISEFYNEVESQGYRIWFSEIDTAVVDEWVSEGKLYLFQLYNKDFSPYSKGRPNMHTLYWKSLFEPSNLEDTVYKLNGEAELFFRPASLHYSEEIKKKGHHAEALKGKFDYPIIKDRRYSTDKFHFHVPITLNFKSQGRENINELVHAFIRSGRDIKVIGIDRGERHLLYVSLIDEHGQILEQFSLNSIRNEKSGADIDYRNKLDARERERQKARQSWDVIENIKEIKEGYLSLVVHEISRILVENQAILIMEDLNTGFKRGRFKVEKQVYQKFEKMLIDKLNYLVFKSQKPNNPGGIRKALQLSNKFDSFQKLGKQSGLIYYVPASYTSKIDPVTGFYNFLNPRNGTIESNQAFFRKFDSIRYNPEKEYFEFKATYGQFVQSTSDRSRRNRNPAAEAELAGKTWTICSHSAERFRIRKSKNGSISYEAFDCNERFKSLLTEAKIAFADGQELRGAISERKDAPFLGQMMDALRVLLALRYNNGKKGTEEKDYILSPVADPNSGAFFNSLEADSSLPLDADANGAYHIARKGLLLIRKIRSFDPEGKRKYPDLFLSKEEWIRFLWFDK